MRRRRPRRIPRSRPLAPAALVLAMAVLACGSEQSPSGPAPEPPPPEAPPTNVVLITIDTLRADALGAYSPGLATSPAIDRLAASGVLFESVVASSPSTLPSHATILTGKEPYAHGARSNHGYVLSAGNQTLAELLRDAGYVTGAEISAVVIGRRLGLDQGFAEFRDVDSHDVELKTATFMKKGERTPVDFKERHAIDVTSKGIGFVQRHRNRPFFLWLHYFDPHRAYAAPREFAKRFPDQPYHAEVAFTDYAVGLLIEELERLGLDERTLVVLTSDHGEALGQHGELTHSHLIYDSTMRVPLILWGPPELPRGRRISELVRSVDITPTILDWLGQPALGNVQGVSVLPLLRGEPGRGEHPAYGESIESFATFGTSILRFLQLGPWKYIHKVNPELYQVAQDPGEEENLVAVEPERAADLRARLEGLLLEAPAPPQGAEVVADPVLMAQLHALGYVGDSRAPDIEDELAALELSGVDPNDTLEDLLRFSAAYGMLNFLEQPEQALATLEELSARHPASVPVLRAQAIALIRLERHAAARDTLTQALELAQSDIDLRSMLIAVLRDLDDPEEAERQAHVLLEQRPCDTLGLANLAGLLQERRRYAEAGALLREAVSRCDTDGARNEYAYFLASSPDASQRNGLHALELALRITQKKGGILPAYIDTLAAAYAETGDYARAVALQRKAIAAIEHRDVSEEMLEHFRSHLADLEAGRPIREN